jgi:hypothetical protein
MRAHFKPIAIPVLAFVVATAFSPGAHAPSPPSITKSVLARIDTVIASAEQGTVSGVRVFRTGTATLTGFDLIYRGVQTRTHPFVVKLGALTLTVIRAEPGSSGSGTPTAGTQVRPEVRDSIHVALPDLPDNVAGSFSIEAEGRFTTTASSFVLAARPRVNQFGALASDARGVQPIANQTLTRGRLYQITGSSLSVRGTTQLLQAGTVRVGTRTMLMQPTADPVTQLRFVVPQEATTGPLVVSTLGGVTALGIFTIADSVAATPRVTGLAISSESVSSGSSATGTVVLDIPGASIDGFTVALSSSHPSVVRVPETVRVPGNSATFAIATSAVTTRQTVTITATAGGARQSRTFTVTPPDIR